MTSSKFFLGIYIINVNIWLAAGAVLSNNVPACVVPGVCFLALSTIAYVAVQKER